MQTASAIKQGLNSPALTVRTLPGSVIIVEGKVGTDAELAQINLLLSGWVKGGKDNKGTSDSSQIDENITIVNAVTVNSSIARQIMVKAQVVDVNNTALKNLGWSGEALTAQALAQQ